MISFTPIENIIYQDQKVYKQYINDTLQIMKTQGNLSSKEFHLLKLGRQDRCRTSFVRYWIWEGVSPFWMVAVSKRGVSFEVPDNFTVVQAFASWKHYLSLVV